MAKLYLDETNIESSVISNLNTAIKCLNSAIYECGKMLIPNDFEFEQYLKQLGNKNYSTVSALTTKKKFLENSKNAYKKIERENFDNFSEIVIFSIPARNNMQQ